MTRNLDAQTVQGFGDEWTRFDQKGLAEHEREELFNRYFHIFPWQLLPAGAVGFDLGCGSGRWAALVAPRIRRLHCIDASESSVAVARRNLASLPNCEFHVASVDQLPLDADSMDFGYSLGVLHHVPDTEAGLRACVNALKPGAPFLLYLYYAFDNRPWWFRLLWRISDLGRRVISRSPMRLRYAISQMIAGIVYYPLARLSFLLERVGVNVDCVPLSSYRAHSFYVMRTDALDRFGTKLEQRFTAAQIRGMMERAGLERITFSGSVPFWCAVGLKK
ncbi:MAG TPA: class I SAM-dependent methyltransferase [Nitrospiraceae bacterium]|nr:class I SAM-dependent methyltransferase [Nitrospiraceae bacterium]